MRRAWAGGSPAPCAAPLAPTLAAAVPDPLHLPSCWLRLQLKRALEAILAQPGAVRPTTARFFRGQMQTIISRALSDLGITPMPSRRCFTLMSERLAGGAAMVWVWACGDVWGGVGTRVRGAGLPRQHLPACRHAIRAPASPPPCRASAPHATLASRLRSSARRLAGGPHGQRVRGAPRV